MQDAATVPAEQVGELLELLTRVLDYNKRPEGADFDRWTANQASVVRGILVGAQVSCHPALGGMTHQVDWAVRQLREHLAERDAKVVPQAAS